MIVLVELLNAACRQGIVPLPLRQSTRVEPGRMIVDADQQGRLLSALG